MASYYSVIQYVPNPIADERVNIGVVAFDESGDCAVRPLESWTRAERFTGQHGRNLQRHVEALEALIRESESPAAAIERASEHWTHSIQVTQPRASLRTIEEILANTAPTVLVEEPARAPRRAGRPELARQAHGSMMQALTRAQLGPVAPEVLKPRSRIEGALEEHDVDLSLRNGKVLVAVRALSFPRARSTYIDYEVSDTAWAVQDLRSSAGHPQVTVLIGPPEDPDRPDFQRARKVLDGLKADVVEPGQLDGWASSTVMNYRRELEAMLPSGS